MRDNLAASLALMFGHEGGYVNSKSDSGGPTKYGITHRTLAAHRGVASVTAAQVRGMTKAEAEEIYRSSYWTQSGGDLLPPGLDYAAFDFGVNSGPARAVESLQAVVGVTQDGIVGARTVAAVAAYKGGVEALIRDYCDERMRYLRTLGGKTGWRPNGRGWTIRVTGKDPLGKYKDAPGVVGNALRMARGAQTVENPPVAGGKANPADRSVVDIVKKEPSLLVSALSALAAFAAGNGPVQWALGAAVVAGVGYAIYRLIKKERANG